MPELCEVLTIASQLKEYLLGTRIIQVNIIGGKYISATAKNEAFRKTLEQFRTDITEKEFHVSDIRSKGKLMIFKLRSEEECVIYILAGLGMNGYWGKTKEKNSAFEIIFRNEQKDRSHKPLKPLKIYFTDPRRFGNVDFYGIERVAEAKTKINKIAKTFLSAHKPYIITKEEFLERFEKVQKGRSKNTPLVKILLDQNRIVSGIGNYLYSEICYLARVDPFCNVGEVEKPLKIYKAAKKLIKSISDCPLVLDFKLFSDGSDGGSEDGAGFGDAKAPLLNVYHREEDQEGRPVHQKTGAHGRTIWYVDWD